MPRGPASNGFAFFTTSHISHDASFRIYGNGPAEVEEYYMRAALVIEPSSKKRDRDDEDSDSDSESVS